MTIAEYKGMKIVKSPSGYRIMGRPTVYETLVSATIAIDRVVQ